MIFIQSSFPSNKFPDVEFEFFDKLIHLLLYAVLFLLFVYSLKNQNKYIKLKQYAPAFSLLFTVFYGASDEIHQLFVVNRSCDLYDWLADSAGALLVFLILIIFKSKTSEVKA